MYPPIIVYRALDSDRLCVFNQLADLVKVLHHLGEMDTASAVCDAIDVLVETPNHAPCDQKTLTALLAKHEYYSANLYACSQRQQF